MLAIWDLKCPDITRAVRSSRCKLSLQAGKSPDKSPCVSRGGFHADVVDETFNMSSGKLDAGGMAATLGLSQLMSTLWTDVLLRRT